MQSAPNRKQLHQMLQQVLDQALSCEIGLEVETTDATRLKQELNFCRRGLREYGDNAYDFLIFRTCPTHPETKVWIVRKHQAVHDTDTNYETPEE